MPALAATPSTTSSAARKAATTPARAAARKAPAARPIAALASSAPAPNAAAAPRRRPQVAAAAASSSSPSSAPAPNPVRAAVSSLATAIYKMSASSDPALAGSPLWTALSSLDAGAVAAALDAGASPDEPSPVTRETPLVMIAKRGGHYKYPPAEIPTLLIERGANLEARDPETGKTAFELSLLKGWQNIGYLLLDKGASTAGVAAIKGQLTCPDCKRLVAEKGL